MSPIRIIGKRTIILLGMMVFAGTAASFVPGDTVATASFTSTKLDLKIDSKAWYNGVSVPSATWALKDLTPGVDKFFNLNDVKPGDFGCNVISIHAKKSDAYACIDFKNMKNDESGINEPEALVDPNGNVSGELAAGTEFYGWIDDGDGKFEPPSEETIFGTTIQQALHVLNNKTYAVGDSKNNSFIKQGKTKYVGMCWCTGNLTVNSKTGAMKCDGGVLGNAAQTDSFSVDVLIRAVSSKDQPKFVCDDKSPKGNNGVGNGEDPPPPGIGNSGNDGPGTGPGNSGGSDTAPGKNNNNKPTSGNSDVWRQTSNKNGFSFPFSFGWGLFGSKKS